MWVTHLHFISKQGSQQLGPLLTAGGSSAVFLVADSLFVLNKGPLSFISYAGATQFPAKVFLPLIYGPFAGHHHPPACRPVQVLVAPSRISLVPDPGSVLCLGSNAATVAKPWLIRWSGGVMPVWYVASLEGEKMRGKCKCSSLCPAL